MSNDERRDETTDRLLRRAFAGGQVAREVTPECLDAETLSAWVDGGLVPSAASRTELHVSTCARCQTVLATLTLTEPAAASSAPAAAPFWKRWSLWSPGTMKWVAPAAAGLGAVLVWAVMRPAGTIDTIGPATSMARADDADRGGLEQAPQLEPPTAPPAPAANATAPARSVDPSQAGRLEAAAKAESDAAAPRRQELSKAVESVDRIDEARTPSAPAAAPAPPPPAVLSRSSGLQVSAVAADPAGTAAQSGERPLTVPGSSSPTGTFVQGTPTFPTEINVVAEFGIAVGATLGSASNRVADSTSAPIARGQARGGAGGRGGGVADAPAAGRDADARLRETAAPAGTLRWRVLVNGQVERLPVGAVTLTPVALPQAAFVTNGASPSAVVCWLVGRAGLVLRSTDGQTVVRVSSPVTGDLVSVTATTALQARVVAADGRSFSTTDGGTTWR